MIEQRVNNFVSSQQLLFYMLVIVFFVRMRTFLWIVKDSSARTDNTWSHIFHICLGIIPIVGLARYILIRPVQYRHELHLRKDAILNNQAICIECSTPNERSHFFCFNCGSSLQVRCRKSEKYYPKRYQYSPYSGEPNIDLSDDEDRR